MVDPLISLTSLTGRQVIAGGFAATGVVLVAYGLLRIIVHEFNVMHEERSKDREHAQTSSESTKPHVHKGALSRGVATAFLLLIVACGSFLRLDGLTSKTLTHTEAIVPNLDWPVDISWPPARHSFHDTFWWHFHSEGHPEGYYFFMWIWTKLFGTGLTALRVPSAIFGIGCIFLVYGLGRLAYERRVGLWSAGLVAFSGFHIYWSQFARMYAMGCFLALLSSYSLLQILRKSELPHRWELAYLVASWLAIYTQTFFWTVLAAQMLWVGLLTHASSGATRRILGIQALVVILGSPALAHIIYLGDDVTLPGLSLSFIAQYISFGFLFQPDDLSIPIRSFSSVANLVLLALAVFCISRACSGSRTCVNRSVSLEAFALRNVMPIACGSAMIVLAISMLALRRQSAVMLAAMLPFLAIAVVPGIGILRSTLDGYVGVRARAFVHAFLRVRGGVSLPVALAFLPPIAVLLLSFWTSMLAPRAFMMFIPYVLIVIAAGVADLSRRRLWMFVLTVTLTVSYAASIVHFRSYPTESRDYAGLGQEMASHFEPGDIVFVLPGGWVTTPLFYYLQDLSPIYIAEDYARAVIDKPAARVWLLSFESPQWGAYETTSEEMFDALTKFAPHTEVQARRSRAVLYTRGAASAEFEPIIQNDAEDGRR